MPKIDTSPVRYNSQLDEDAFFEWVQKIPCVSSVAGGVIHVKSTRISESNLRDLIAIMFRYKLPMAQLQQFCNSKNEHWFKAPSAFWHKPVFGSKR